MLRMCVYTQDGALVTSWTTASSVAEAASRATDPHLRDELDALRADIAEGSYPLAAGRYTLLVQRDAIAAN